MLLWTRWEILYFLVVATVPVALFEIAGLKWVQVPWTPIALIGTAVAFLIGFQNNAAYGRAWEARKIWGGIVNESRTWAMLVKALVSNDYTDNPLSEDELENHHRVLIHRHLAWLTALRFAMREERPWEVSTEYRTNREWRDKIPPPEHVSSLEDELSVFLPVDEARRVLGKANKAATVLALQSDHIKRLKEKGVVWEFSFLELEGLLREMFALQGKSERIKNFPYPRQYATISYDFVRIFIYLLPLCVIPEFAELGESLKESFPVVGANFVWAAIPFSVVISWVFNTMLRIGTVGENPFEGTANDVPISTIARGIEIDLREMLDEPKESIPAPLEAKYNIQM